MKVVSIFCQFNSLEKRLCCVTSMSFCASGEYLTNTVRTCRVGMHIPCRSVLHPMLTISPSCKIFSLLGIPCTTSSLTETQNGCRDIRCNSESSERSQNHGSRCSPSWSMLPWSKYPDLIACFQFFVYDIPAVFLPHASTQSHLADLIVTDIIYAPKIFVIAVNTSFMSCVPSTSFRMPCFV